MDTAIHTGVVIQAASVAEQHRQASIVGLTALEISARLGFPPNGADNPDKVVNCWEFTVDGVPCAVWDYRGSDTLNPPRHSGFGPLASLIAALGHDHVTAFPR
jgi:hypothetical protein